MIQLKAIRKLKSNPDFIVYDIRGFKKPARVKFRTAPEMEELPEEVLKNVIKTQIYDQLRIELKE